MTYRKEYHRYYKGGKWKSYICRYTGTDKLLLLSTPREGLDAHDKTGGKSSTRISRTGIVWDEVQEAVEDRRSWWNRVAQCVFYARTTMNQESEPTPTESVSVCRMFGSFCLFVCLSVCYSVCPQYNSKMNDPKMFKLDVGNDLGIS